MDAILVAPSVFPRSMEYSEADDIPGPLLERTIPWHGLPDPSTHSTFVNQDGDGSNPCPIEPAGPWSERRLHLSVVHKHRLYIGCQLVF